MTHKRRLAHSSHMVALTVMAGVSASSYDGEMFRNTRFLEEPYWKKLQKRKKITKK